VGGLFRRNPVGKVRRCAKRLQLCVSRAVDDSLHAGLVVAIVSAFLHSLSSHLAFAWCSVLFCTERALTRL
jgi:hypothetical protein